ncbi:MAG TPA: hypothetical protein VFI18_05160 [Gaiellales bacterium]|nr:hypothetical protein [Gaiellales bacterium]
MSDQPGQNPDPSEVSSTPLVGYRDIPQPTGHEKTGLGWVILAAMTVAYLVWTLAVYFLEPGIR